jgi:hypothetical protein
MVYVGSSRPDLVDCITLKTFTAMVERVRDRAINAGIVDAETFDAGIRALYRTAEPGGFSATPSSRQWARRQALIRRRDLLRHWSAPFSDCRKATFRSS